MLAQDWKRPTARRSDLLAAHDVTLTVQGDGQAALDG
jgi:hypothetical protein